MITIRKSSERGLADHGWLQSRHTFSFADYYDPRQMGFSVLRVINEDRVAPGEGFPTHGHRDMEIVSYVLEGALEHKDTTGTHSVIRPGEVQRMSAGRGVRHSEYNASKSEGVHFLQIWIEPRERGIPAGYEQRAFPTAKDGAPAGLTLVASPDGAEGSLTIAQDARIHRVLLDGGQEVALPLGPGRRGWLQVVRGALELAGRALEPGDGAALSDEKSPALRALGPSEALYFDLP